ncbi:MAG: hypothetical protein FD189_1694 [Elusimicrobia bacterium]|nr:MAG: hypothetical protein FD154_1860 [Elusimicrobiota bacterium]KAF0154814.1 MAG: hypothetical protein FD189_1694 [Elusimicrobiota bacterium]
MADIRIYGSGSAFRHARATRDIDLGFRGEPDTGGEALAGYIQRSLAKAARADLGDFFVFEVGGMRMELDGPVYGGARYPVRAMVDARLFAAFHVDAAVGDYVPGEVESAGEDDFLSFAGIKAASFPIIPREVQFAEKLHAYTMPRSVPNSRVRDLVDMALLITEGGMSPDKVSAALKKVFGRRKTHALPETLEQAPERWNLRFAELAEECGLKMSLSEAFGSVAGFYRGATAPPGHG